MPRTRNPLARYWIPSDNEWYKAAYYDPTRLGVRKYWDFATRSCNTPNNLPPPGDEYSANYFRETFAIGKPYFLTEVGAYPKASSYFGTYDQNGDVWEWVEDWKQMRIDPFHKGRITRGGSATYSEIGLHAMNADPLNPAHEAFVFGGRLARAARCGFRDGRLFRSLKRLVSPGRRSQVVECRADEPSIARHRVLSRIRIGGDRPGNVGDRVACDEANEEPSKTIRNSLRLERHRP